jgi:ABC-type nitrate/sulfonate/bicarbonate transport system permease component
MMLRILRGLVLPIAVVLLWEGASRTGILTFEYLSRPSDILKAGAASLLDGSILLATWQTFEAALFGLALAAAVGILSGALLGLSATAERIVGPTIEALRPIPAVAFIPLSLLLFGFGLPMEGMVVAYACVWPILIATIHAVRGIEPRLLEVARVLELPFATTLRKVILPAALGRINVGVRVAAGFALVVAVTVEIIVNPRGLGYSLIVAQQSLRIDLMYAQLLWLSIVGYAINAALRTVRITQPSLQAGGRP